MDRRPHNSLVKFGSKARAARIHASFVSSVHDGALRAWAEVIERLASNGEDFLPMNAADLTGSNHCALLTRLWMATMVLQALPVPHLNRGSATLIATCCARRVNVRPHPGQVRRERSRFSPMPFGLSLRPERRGNFYPFKKSLPCGAITRNVVEEPSRFENPPSSRVVQRNVNSRIKICRKRGQRHVHVGRQLLDYLPARAERG